MKSDYLSYFKYGTQEVDLVAQQLRKNFNITQTSSTGRVLDAISAILEICGERTYEGECAMKLESAAYNGDEIIDIPIKIKKQNGLDVLDTSKILVSVLNEKLSGEEN